MTFGTLLHAFFADDKLKIALAMIFVDFVLGVVAAVKLGNFRLSYVSDLLRNDVLFKLVPWFVLYAGAIVAGQQSILIGGVTMGTVAGSVYALLVAAIGSSILVSLNELRLAGGGTQTLATALTAPENASPPKD
jgi:hypothetical protein